MFDDLERELAAKYDEMKRRERLLGEEYDILYRHKTIEDLEVFVQRCLKVRGEILAVVKEYEALMPEDELYHHPWGITSYHSGRETIRGLRSLADTINSVYIELTLRDIEEWEDEGMPGHPDYNPEDDW